MVNLKTVLSILTFFALVSLGYGAEPTKVGAKACSMCHKKQFTSWEGSKHAKQTPQVECETCHGVGSEYKKLGGKMKSDPVAAKAAGLTAKPEKSFCLAKCHTADKFNYEEAIKVVHKHKAK
jgi:hypothetical protein